MAGWLYRVSPGWSNRPEADPKSGIPEPFRPSDQGKRDFVTESSQEQLNTRAVLIQQSDELSEFAELLNEFGVSIDVRRGPLPTADDLAGASIVVVPGGRLTESGTPNLAFWPRTIAVLDNASKTLVSHLNRLGVAMVIRRPLHPRTLRLLLLHEIYRGPERRKRKRILIGHPIRVGSGLFPQRATLLELSPTGARLDLPNAPEIGSTLRLLLGKDLTLDKSLKLKVRVKRCIRPAGGQERSGSEVGVVLLDRKRHANAIQGILDRFSTGPAAWNGKLAAPETPRPSTPQPAQESLASKESTPTPSARKLPPSFSPASPAPASLPPVAPVHAAPAPTPVHLASTPAPVTEHEIEFEDASELAVEETPIDEAPERDLAHESDAAATDAESSERRSDPRVPYDQRVVALGEEAARILVGRDLSQGGMRIAANDAVEIGDVLRVALHSGTASEPLVVIARAHRNDTCDGYAEMVLTFENLSDGQQILLEKIIASSDPIPASGEDGEGRDGAVVFGEMLEMVERNSRLVDSDLEIDAHLDSIFDAGESVEDAR